MPQIVYTLVRPTTSVKFVDLTVPGFVDYIDAIATAGFNHAEVLSEDQLTLTSTYTFADAIALTAYEDFLSTYEPTRSIDRQRREDLGIITTKTVID